MSKHQKGNRFIMRRSKKRRPELEEKLAQVERQMRDARGRLRWRVDDALLPLEIQESHSISQLKGDVLVISYNRDVRDKIVNVLESENYRYDVIGRGSQAVAMLKLAKYRMVIADFSRFRRTRIFEFIQRYQSHVKVISIVSDDRTARYLMERGSYSFLMGRNFDPEQLRTCLVSSLRLKHRVCGLQAHGEKCNRSCVNSYQTEDDLDFMELE
jgi:PleD family two-component response regulator